MFDLLKFYIKIYYLTREFRVKLHAKTDTTNREAMSAIIGFPWNA